MAAQGDDVETSRCSAAELTAAHVCFLQTAEHFVSVYFVDCQDTGEHLG